MTSTDNSIQPLSPDLWTKYGEHLPCGFMVFNPVNDEIIAVNNVLADLLSKNKTELVRQKVSSLFKNNFNQLLLFTQEVLEKDTAWTDSLTYEFASKTVQLEILARCINEPSETVILALIQDASELKTLRDQQEAQRYFLSGLGHWNQTTQVFQEFERENQLLLDAAGEGIYGVDVNGLTTFINPAVERILGYTAAELAGKNMHVMIHHSFKNGDHFDARDCPIYEAFRDGVVHSVEQDVFWSKSGQPVYVDYTSTPIRDNGEIIGAVIVFRDVSQKINDQKNLIAALEEVERLKNRLEQENAYLLEEINSEFNHQQIIGTSLAIQKVIQQIELVAPTDATVLITGESGTGKELIARAIHESSTRRDRPLIRVNCAAIPSDLFESEFFGHIKGAFTGATADRAGRFELADGGTIFLDEVGEIPLHLQSKLLRVLQEQQFERIGDAKTRITDVRIIAATNKNLQQLVAAGLFREDLYFRLNVFPLASPSLRDRIDDIPLLTHHFLKKVCTKINKELLELPIGEVEKLKSYNWPGNIRELENIIERQVILATGNKLRFPDFQQTPSIQGKSSPAKVDILSEEAIREFERVNTQNALTHCNGKVFGSDGAAQLLGIKATTLISRIKKWGLNDD
ncbi:sigma-54 interaction domain-containing protein [Sessilibacter sp. MAH4]